MKKKLILGLTLLVTVAGLAFAVNQAYCAAVTCHGCGESGRYDVGASSAKKAAEKAYDNIRHGNTKDGKPCPGGNPRSKKYNTTKRRTIENASVQTGFCPIPPIVLDLIVYSQEDY